MFFIQIIILILMKMLSKFINRKQQQKKEAKQKKQAEKRVEKQTQKQQMQKGQTSSQESEQIIDSLIYMNNQLKITKNTPQLESSYSTLCYVNTLLCEETINVQAIRLFLRNKSNEKHDYHREMGSNKANNGDHKKMENIYSNGLIFQYYSIRALLWKISLRYLPSSKNKWISYMEGKMIEYHEMIKEHILDLIVKKKKKKEIQNQSAEKMIIQSERRKSASDHPLNLLKQSKWKTFFDDRQLWHMIQKDTIRTKPKCLFFQLEYEIQFMQTDILNKYEIKKPQIHLSKLKDKQKTYYYDCLTRIIYIYLKRNPQIQYCQGMNELAALIFYSFANKNSEYFRRVAESDSFFCFQKIMTQLIKCSNNNIFFSGQKYSIRFKELLKKIDLRLYEKLMGREEYFNHLNIVSIKWFNSLFLGEYEIDDSLVLWDCFVSIVHRNQINGENQISIPNLLVALGLAIVHLNRKQLDNGENPLTLFAKIQISPSILIEKAFNLYKIFHQYFL